MHLKLSLICLFQKIGYDKAAAVAKKAHKEGSTLKVMMMPSYSCFFCFSSVIWPLSMKIQKKMTLILNKFSVRSIYFCKYHFDSYIGLRIIDSSIVCMDEFIPITWFLHAGSTIFLNYWNWNDDQEAALKLGVLTSEEFDSLVVPEKMLGPSDWLAYDDVLL